MARTWGVLLVLSLSLRIASAQSVAADWTSGATFGDVPTRGATHGLGIDAGLAVVPNFVVSGRYELLALEPSGPGGKRFSNQLLGQLELRWFTFEPGREAWALTVGYGTGLRPDALGGNASVGRVAIAREAGLDLQHATAMVTAVELAYEHSFADPHLDMALASIRVGIERLSAKPDLSIQPRRWHRTVSLDVFAPAGLGMGFGLRANPHLSLETNGNFNADVAGSSLRGFRDAEWAVQTGPRLQLVAWPIDFAPLYVQLQAGVAWIARDPGELRAVQTAEMGVRLLCGKLGVDAGAWFRTQIAGGGLDPIAGGLAVRIVLGGDRTAIGGFGLQCPDDEGSASPGGTTYTISTDGGGSGSFELRVTVPPPAPRVEDVAPRAGFVWIAGHWGYRGGTWVWIGGQWAAEQPGKVWVPGRWQSEGNGYVWIEGSWQVRP